MVIPDKKKILRVTLEIDIALTPEDMEMQTEDMKDCLNDLLLDILYKDYKAIENIHTVDREIVDEDE